MKQCEWKSSWQLGHNQVENVRKWNAGIDAVTVIGMDHHAALPFYNEYDNIKVRQGIGHVDDKPWGLHGYRGKQCGSARVGLKDDRTILMVTGPQAERVFAVSKALNVKYTRIDLQVTIEMETPVRSLASDHYQSPNLTRAMERGKMYLSLINSPNGDTLYLNKRTSPSFGRVYDKSRDYMGVLGQYWRWEVELKEEISDRMGRVLEVLTEYTDIAADYVAGWYADRDLCVPLGKRDTVSIPETFPASSGFAQTLAWLAKQVRPSLEILRQAGLSEDAEKALGVQLTFPDYDNE